jgi:hypothetical protein
MKKLVLMFSILLLGIGAFSQISTSDSLLQNTAVERIYADFTSKIEALALQLKVPAEFVYKTIVKQQVISGYTGIFVTISVFLFIILCWAIGHYVCKHEVGMFDLDDYYDGLGIFFIIMMIISIISIIIATGSGIIHITNPDYYAIREILHLL